MKDNIVATGKGVFSKESNPKDRIFTDHKKMEQLVFHCRGLGLKIVLTQGSYDMVHIGHGRYLEDAKKKGDLLIVGVDSDKKVKHRKGPDRPVVPQDERLEMLTHMRSVDAVFLKELHHPKWSLIKTIRPDVLIATKETYSKAQLKELKKYCKEIVVLERRATTSASAKIRNLQINTAKKLGQALTPKLIKTIEEVLAGVK
ncbi:TPA: hypothetical protein DCQ44_02135 [Candidatus Taylorbacteria bacterium]|nr:hypothetical protein [Candidatus Taylorbacteria bacterium]